MIKIKKKKTITLTEEEYKVLIDEIQDENFKDLKNENIGADIILLDQLASMKFAIKLKQRLFDGDCDEE